MDITTGDLGLTTSAIIPFLNPMFAFANYVRQNFLNWFEIAVATSALGVDIASYGTGVAIALKAAALIVLGYSAIMTITHYLTDLNDCDDSPNTTTDTTSCVASSNNSDGSGGGGSRQHAL